MCSVSEVSDYYTNTWPNRFNQPSPFQQPMATTGITQTIVPTVDAETKEMMRKVLQLLDRIDKKLGDVECMDAAKAEFLKSLDLDPNNIGG